MNAINRATASATVQSRVQRIMARVQSEQSAVQCKCNGAGVLRTRPLLALSECVESIALRLNTVRCYAEGSPLLANGRAAAVILARVANHSGDVVTVQLCLSNVEHCRAVDEHICGVFVKRRHNGFQSLSIVKGKQRSSKLFTLCSRQACLSIP